MNNKVIVALDYETEREALNFVEQVDPSLCRLKVGKENVYYAWHKFL